jgi:hypothetical protein
MSNDRGQEFSDHYEKKSKVKVYFAIHTRVIKEARMKTGLVPSGNTKKTDLTNLTNLEKIEFQINEVS